MTYQIADKVHRGMKGRRPVLTQGPKGPLLGHQGEETRFQGVCDDDIKQLFKILPVTARETT